MKMNKLVAVVAAGMITMGAAVSASAAGVGYVNVAALLRAHPKFERAQLELQSTEQKLSADFEKQRKEQDTSAATAVARRSTETIGRKAAVSNGSDSA